MRNKGIVALVVFIYNNLLERCGMCFIRGEGGMLKNVKNLAVSKKVLFVCVCECVHSIGGGGGFKC